MALMIIFIEKIEGFSIYFAVSDSLMSTLASKNKILFPYLRHRMFNLHGSQSKYFSKKGLLSLTTCIIYAIEFHQVIAASSLYNFWPS